MNRPILPPVGPPIRPPTQPPPTIPGGSVTPTDPFWAQTVLLLNGNALEDATGRHALIAYEGIVTASGGFLQFGGAASLRIEDNLADFAGGGPYTWEGESFSPVDLAATAVLLSTLDVGNGWEIFERPNPNSTGGYYVDGGVYQEPGGLSWADGLSHPWAMVMDENNNFSFYFEGTRHAFVEDVPNPAGVGPLFIGRESATSAKNFIGGMRCRLTRAARYSGPSYVPPTYPLPTS